MSAAVVIPQKGNTHLTANLRAQIKRHETCPVLVVDDDGSGITASWNRGIERAIDNGCEWIVLLNNDVDCDGPFVDSLLGGGFLNVMGVCKRTEPLGSWRVLEGWCLAFHIDLWNAVGGFDERLRYYYSDTAFQLKCVKRGAKLKALPVPLVHHGHKTAHNPQLFPDRRKRYLEDKRMFQSLLPELL